MTSNNSSKLQSIVNLLREVKTPKIFFNLLREFTRELFIGSTHKSCVKKIRLSEKSESVSPWFSLNKLEEFFDLDNSDASRKILNEKKGQEREIFRKRWEKLCICQIVDFDGYEKEFNIDEYKMHAMRVLDSINDNKNSSEKRIKKYLYCYSRETGELIRGDNYE